MFKTCKSSGFHFLQNFGWLHPDHSRLVAEEELIKSFWNESGKGNDNGQDQSVTIVLCEL